MDTSVNPCEDFHQYVCGGWESEMISKGIKNGILGLLHVEININTE